MNCCNTGSNDLKGVSSFWHTQVFNELEYNMKYFLEYGLLRVGAWIDVVDGTNQCGEDLYTLKPTSFPDGSSQNTVFTAPRKDWVYESVTHNGNTPQTPVISVNNVVQAGNFSINYPLGLVTFNTAINGTVTASYAFKAVQIYLANSSPFWQEIQYNTYEPSKSNRQIQDEIMNIFTKNNIQLPAIIIEVDNNMSSAPFQLGGCENWCYIDVKLTVIGEDRAARNKVMSILSMQKDKSIHLFNTDTATFPLDCDGSVANNNSYIDILNDNQWKCARIFDIKGQKFESPCPNLHLGSIIYTVEVLDPQKTL